MEKNPGYTIIEPSVYEKLGWQDMDFIVQFLEAVRRDMEDMNFQWAIKAGFYLISYENPFGASYPVIAVYSEGKETLCNIPDFFSLAELVDQVISEIGFDELKKKALTITVPKWEELQRMERFPEELLSL